MATYEGPATLIDAHGTRIPGLVSLRTGIQGNVAIWAGKFQPDQVTADVLNAAADCKIELPDGEVGSVVVAHSAHLSPAAPSIRVSLTGSGPAPF